MSANKPTAAEWLYGDADEWWYRPDSPERRAALGHQYDHSAPGYCTCGRWQHVGTVGARGERIDPAPTAEAPAWRRVAE